MPPSPSIPQHSPSPLRWLPPTPNPQPGSHQGPIYVLPIHSRVPTTGLQLPYRILSPNSTHPQATVTAEKKPFVHESSTCITQTHTTTIIQPPRKTHIAHLILPFCRSSPVLRVIVGLRRSRQRRRWRTRLLPCSRGDPESFGLPSSVLWRVSWEPDTGWGVPTAVSRRPDVPRTAREQDRTSLPSVQSRSVQEMGAVPYRVLLQPSSAVDTHPPKSPGRGTRPAAGRGSLPR